MEKVYIVTSGSYSDYSINAVFDSRENAELFVSSGCSLCKANTQQHKIENKRDRSRAKLNLVEITREELEAGRSSAYEYAV